MTIYETVNCAEKVAVRILCNKCGREIDVVEGIPREDVLTVRKRWGYFSGKDNREDSFELCERCYDEFTEAFRIPIEKKE